MPRGINRLYRIGETIKCRCGCGMGGKVTKVDLDNRVYYYYDEVENNNYPADIELFHDIEFENLIRVKEVWNKPYLGDGNAT